MADKADPIGIIDSGIGGFSVARKMQRLLPHENLLYFGDGGNMPYGNHSAGKILRLTRYMLRFMEQRRVKALLVACNTISCLIGQYQDGLDFPVFSVVQAGAEAAARLPAHKIGVISTYFTHSTQCYPKLLRQIAPDKLVISRGYSDLAKFIEHHLGDPAGQEVIDQNIRANLDELVHGEKIDCCLLGCTHSPLVEENIQRLYPGLLLLDPADEMARAAGAFLGENGLLNGQSAKGALDIYTTGCVEEYRDKAVKAGLDPVTSVHPYPPLREA